MTCTGQPNGFGEKRHHDVFGDGAASGEDIDVGVTNHKTTNAIGIMRALCKKNREKGLFSCCLCCRNEAVIAGSAAFFMPVSFACCGHPTVAASKLCMNSPLNSQGICLCLQ